MTLEKLLVNRLPGIPGITGIFYAAIQCFLKIPLFLACAAYDQ